MQKHVHDFYRANPAQYNQHVSLIIPVFNRAERLARCLAGVFHQTYPRSLIEVVVVDDGSSDDVAAVINKYRQRLNLKYIKQVDKGYRLSAARNLGIRSAEHDNIIILDCDLIPLPFFVEAFMQYLHHFDNVILLGHQRFVDPTGVTDDDILARVEVLNELPDIVSENSTMKVTDSDRGPTRDWRYSLYEQSNYLKNDEFPYRAFSSGHVAYRKAAIERAGLYDEDFNVWGCEDNEAGYRLYNQGYFFIPVLEAIDLHQEPPSGKNETDREQDRLISRNLLQAKCPAFRSWFGTPYELKEGDAPLVTIAIASHNTKPFILEAVNSALGQGRDDIEVLIYDDASTDGTQSLLRDTYAQNSRVRIHCGRDRRGVTFARNFLIGEARGEFVGFLDSDDLLAPNCVDECVKAFRANPNVGLVCTGYSIIDEEGNNLEDGWEPNPFTREAMFFGNIFTHFRIFRIRDWNRSAKWTDVEIQTLFYGEDWDLCLKLAEVTDFARIPSKLYKYRLRKSSITRANHHDALIAQTLTVARSLLRRQKIGGIDVFSVGNNLHRIAYEEAL
jgi:chondroitin synthase